MFLADAGEHARRRGCLDAFVDVVDIVDDYNDDHEEYGHDDPGLER